MKTSSPSICCLFILLFSYSVGQAQGILYLNNNLTLTNKDSNLSFQVSVPFTLSGTLLKEHKSDSLYRNTFFNHKKLAQSTWTLEIDFMNPGINTGSKQYLILDQIATNTTIFLNNKEIGKTENAFLSYSFYINPYLASRKNTLKIVIHPTSAHDIPLTQMDLSWISDKSELHRESQLYRALGIDGLSAVRGILGGIKVEYWETLRVYSRDVKPQPKDNLQAGVVKESLDIDFFLKSGKSLVWERQVYRKGLPTPINSVSDTIAMRSQELHSSLDISYVAPWASGTTDNSFYGYKSSLKSNGITLWTDSLSIAFRKAGITRDNKTRIPTFHLNEVPQFVHGITVYPFDYLADFISDDAWDYYFHLLQQTNADLIRIPAGTTYVPEKFYRYCDSLGILIWHDFMFYDAIYPFSNAYIKNLESEVKQVVRRAGHHPSIYLWNGNQNVHSHLINSDLNTPKHRGDFIRYEQNYKRLFHDKIPAILRKYAPELLYLETTTFYKNSFSQKALSFVDFPPDTEIPQLARAPFISSCGFYGLPNIEFAGQNLKYRVSPDPHKIIREDIFNLFGYESTRKQEDDKERYLSQVIQYISLEKAINNSITDWPHSTGIIIDRFNDPLPIISNSIIDYGGDVKAGFYSVRHNYAPITVYFKEEGKELIPVLKTTYREPITYTFVLEKWDLQQGALLSTDTASIIREEREIYQMDNLFEKKIEKSENILWRLRLINHALLRNKSGGYATNFTIDYKNTVFPQPSISITATQEKGGEYLLSITSDQFSFYTQLTASVPGSFSDNYIHLMPGEETEIYFTPFEKAGVIEFSSLSLNEVLSKE